MCIAALYSSYLIYLDTADHVGQTFIAAAVLPERMDCRVVVEGAVPVYDVETPDEAVRIAISKTGGMLNPDLSYVEIEPAERTAPDGSEWPAALVAADEALVALEFELTVFNVETTQHADRIARSELGGALEDIPLTVESVEALSGEPEADGDDDSEGTGTASETAPDDDGPAGS